MSREGEDGLTVLCFWTSIGNGLFNRAANSGGLAARLDGDISLEEGDFAWWEEVAQESLFDS